MYTTLLVDFRVAFSNNGVAYREATMGSQHYHNSSWRGQWDAQIHIPMSLAVIGVILWRKASWHCSARGAYKAQTAGMLQTGSQVDF